MNADPEGLFPAHLSAHPSVSIPALGAFQLRLTPFNSTPTFARIGTRGGESYFDLISRLEPCIQEMESYNEPLLIVSHQAILRCIFAYLTGVDREKAPGMETQIQVRAGVFFSLASLSVDHTFHHVTKSLTNPP